MMQILKWPTDRLILGGVVPQQTFQHWQIHILLLLCGALSATLVDSHVVLEVGLAHEVLLADTALVGTFTSVDAFVPQQVVAHSERSRTERACKGPLSRVAPQVPHQKTVTGSPVAAYRALGRFQWRHSFLCRLSSCKGEPNSQVVRNTLWNPIQEYLVIKKIDRTRKGHRIFTM